MFESSYHAESDSVNPETAKKLENMFYWCHVRLGGTSIPVQLEDDDYKVAFEEALGLYRTRSSRSVWETYCFLELKARQTQYTLDRRIDSVFRILRNRGFGAIGAAGSGFESFGAATINALLRGGLSGSASGGFNLTTYEFAMQHQELIERLFATEIHFNFRADNSQLYIYQVPQGDELVALQCSVLKSIDEVMNDNSAMQWLRRYTLAVCKTILGEKLSLFATLPGALGGSTTKGDTIRQQGELEKEKLEQEILDFADNSSIPLIVRG